MFKKIIQNIFHSLNLSLKRVDPSQNNYQWLSELKIQTVIDVGANKGQFAKFISSHLPKAKIYSFEPIESVFNELNSNTSSLNIETFNFALGDKNEFQEIIVHDFSPSSSLLEETALHTENFSRGSGRKKEKIEVKRLDDLDLKEMKNDILLKLDVQGYEDRVLRGANEFIKRSKVVVLEVNLYPLYKTEKGFDYFYSLFKERGFDFKGVFVTQTKSPKNGIPLFFDAVFIKSEK